MAWKEHDTHNFYMGHIMGLPGVPELLIIGFVLALLIGVPVAIVFIVLRVTDRKEKP